METQISVIMSVYDEEASYLRESLQSILNQSFSDFECIIIDDGSRLPHVQEILSQFEKQDARIKLCTNATNLGLTASLNKALTLAKGVYIARIDSDDIADSNRLEKQLKFMEANPSYALCGSWAYFIDQNGKIIGEKKTPTDYESIKRKLLFYNFFTHSSFFFRREIALDGGVYNERLKKAQDYDFILKISAKYSVAILPEFLCSLRLHEGSISSHSKKKQEWCALRARFNAVWHYGYPKIDSIKIIPSIFYFLFVPCFLEEKIFAVMRKDNEMFLLREFFKSFIFSKKKRIGFVLCVPPTPYYGKIMASARLRVYDVINNFQNNPDFFLELYKPWKKYDIVVFQKKFDSRALGLAQKLKRAGVKIILDINVNYYDRTAFTDDVKSGHDQIMIFTRIADGVITSTGYIEEYVKRLFPEKIITTIPENITDTFFSVRKKIPDTDTPLKLLYVGYSEKASEIMQIEDTLRQLLEHHHFSLLLICDRDPKISIPGIEIKFIRYRQREIHTRMLEGDIFIAPRDMNNSYNLGHSFTKIGYPMSVGIPVIASTVPSYTGSPAILCENKADWYNNLDALLKNRQKREILAGHGIAYCQEHFSKSVITEEYISFFNTALSLK